MKTTLLALVAFLLFLSNGSAQNTYIVKSIKASVNGSSTLHDWESDVTKIDCNAHFDISNNILKAIKDIRVVIPVSGIKSKEGGLMDSKTYEAFKYEEFPNIIYETADAEVTIESGNAIIKASGKLTMAGTALPIMLEASGKVLPNGDLDVELSKSLKMTDFKMTPPTAILGTIKVGNEVTIKAKLILTNSDSLVATKSK